MKRNGGITDMIAKILLFIVAFNLGVIIGVFFVSLCSANGRDDDEFTCNTCNKSDKKK